MAAEENKEDKRVGANGYRIPEDRYIAARVIYEATPGMTLAKLAEETGISHRSLEERSRRDGGWKKVEVLPPTEMSDTAQQVADMYNGKLEEYGEEITTEQKQAVIAETVEDVAVSLRAQLIDRHRREWGAIRARAYKQLNPDNKMTEQQRFEMSKTTKINAETLQIIQQNERKAWGIDPSNQDKPSMVVIERD